MGKGSSSKSGKGSTSKSGKGGKGLKGTSGTGSHGSGSQSSEITSTMYADRLNSAAAPMVPVVGTVAGLLVAMALL